MKGTLSLVGAVFLALTLTACPPGDQRCDCTGEACAGTISCKNCDVCTRNGCTCEPSSGFRAVEEAESLLNIKGFEIVVQGSVATLLRPAIFDSPEPTIGWKGELELISKPSEESSTIAISAESLHLRDDQKWWLASWINPSTIAWFDEATTSGQLERELFGMIFGSMKNVEAYLRWKSDGAGVLRVDSPNTWGCSASEEIALDGVRVSIDGKSVDHGTLRIRGKGTVSGDQPQQLARYLGSWARTLRQFTK